MHNYAFPRVMLRLVHFLLTAVCLHFTSSSAFAVPVLQLYIEGATYDAGTESWVFVSPTSGAPIRVWTIGNVAGAGGKGTIHDVKLAIVYDSDLSVGSISLTPATTGGFGSVSDPSVPIGATHVQTVSDGSVPKLSDGGDLPSHGEYGSGRTWQEFYLGDFSLTDSPIGDFIDSFPTEFSGSGQINVYEVNVASNGSDQVFELHFDLYDNIQTRNKARAVFAPFSHDATGTVDITPEAASLVAWLLSGALVGLVVFYRRGRFTLSQSAR